MTPPSAEEFAAWRENPITQWVLRGCELAAEENRRDWQDKTWASGIADPLHLLETRTRADAYRALHDTTYEGWVETHDRYR